MSHRIRIVDVFTERALAGNQLAVVLGAEGIPSELMQAIAREMNFSETTFVMAPADPSNAASVRIFTPTTELPFAGHPTVGTAWVLRDEGLLPEGAESPVLEERIGPVPVRVERSAGIERLWMTHPSVRFGDVFEDRAKIASALGLTTDQLAPGVPIQTGSTGVEFLYVALRDADAVDAAVSNEARLADGVGGRPLPYFLFAATGSGHLYSRMFGPHAMAIEEDAATGSGSGPLGAFAVMHGLVPRAPVVRLVSEQGTRMGRQSFIHIELEYPGEVDLPSRIEVGGSVMPVLAGTLTL